MTTLLRKTGFKFSFNPEACSTCKGTCCSGESGNVWLSQDDVDRICKVLKIHSINFFKDYTRLVNNRVSLLETRTQDSFDCVFFDSIRCQCKLYEARPEQCRDFPFWPYFKTNAIVAGRECPGVSLD